MSSATEKGWVERIFAVGAPRQNGAAADTGAEMAVYDALFADGFEDGFIYWALYF